MLEQLFFFGLDFCRAFDLRGYFRFFPWIEFVTQDDLLDLFISLGLHGFVLTLWLLLRLHHFILFLLDFRQFCLFFLSHFKRSLQVPSPDNGLLLDDGNFILLQLELFPSATLLVFGLL